MSAYAISRRHDWMDFVNLLLDIFAPLFAFLAKPEARPVPQPTTPPAPTPIPVGWRSLDDLPASAEIPQSAPATAVGPSDDDTQEIIVQPMPGPLPAGADDYDDDRRAEAMAEVEADEPVICGPLYVRTGEGKAVRYMPYDSLGGEPVAVDGRGVILYRRRRVGKRWVYDVVK